MISLGLSFFFIILFLISFVNLVQWSLPIGIFANFSKPVWSLWHHTWHLFALLYCSENRLSIHRTLLPYILLVKVGVRVRAIIIRSLVIIVNNLIFLLLVRFFNLWFLDDVRRILLSVTVAKLLPESFPGRFEGRQGNGHFFLVNLSWVLISSIGFKGWSLLYFLLERTWFPHGNLRRILTEITLALDTVLHYFRIKADQLCT